MDIIQRFIIAIPILFAFGALASFLSFIAHKISRKTFGQNIQTDFSPLDVNPSGYVQPNFPKYYIILWYIYLLALVISLVGGSLLISNQLYATQVKFLTKTNTDIIIAPLTYAISLLNSIFFLSPIILLFFKALTHLFSPSFQQFIWKKRHLGLTFHYPSTTIAQKKYLADTVNLEKAIQREWREFSYLPYLLTFCMVIYALAFNTYTLIDDIGVHRNQLITLKPTTYTWKEIEAVNLTSVITHDSEYGDKFKPKLTISASDKTLNIWDDLGGGVASPQQINYFLNKAHSYNIPCSVTPLAPHAKRLLGTSEFRRAVIATFEDAEAICEAVE